MNDTNQKQNNGPMTLEKLADKIDTGFEQMAQMVAKGFDNTATKEDMTAVEARLGDVESKLGTVETKLDRALYTEVVHLETRIRAVEEKVGIKSPAAKPIAP